MKNKKGFTLIELLVVVLIIGILAAIALPQYHLAVAKSRAAEALSVIKSLQPALDEYVLMHGTLPKTFNDLSVIPQGLEGKYKIQGDRIYGKYYNFILVQCRLDVGPTNYPTGYEPAFVYQACKGGFSAFDPHHIYCYHLDSDPHAEQKASICRQFTSKEPVRYDSDNDLAYEL